jgi:hypothetical protein
MCVLQREEHGAAVCANDMHMEYSNVCTFVVVAFMHQIHFLFSSTLSHRDMRMHILMAESEMQERKHGNNALTHKMYFFSL